MERSFKCKFMPCLAFCGRRIEFPFVIAVPQRILLHIVIILSLCDSRAAAASFIGLDLVSIYLFFPSPLSLSRSLSVSSDSISFWAAVYALRRVESYFYRDY